MSSKKIYLNDKMTHDQENEVLDFCRIKKIFDKGFGFLSSLHHSENVFFHFSKITDSSKRNTLENLQRGVVSVFFTSKISNGKRKVDKVWLDIAEVPHILIPNFIDRLILELNDGTVNPFDIIDALNQVKSIDKLSDEHFQQIISSKKIQINPSILDKIFSEEEKAKQFSNSGN